jgi:hypothetical protein
MKKINLAFWQLLFLLPLFSYAQEETYKESMDNLLVNVNKSQLTTNILYDRVYSFANLESDTPIKLNYNNFMQAWNELYNASYNPPFITANVLQDKVKAGLNTNEIPLGIINLKMNYIDFGTDADPNLVYTNNLFQNIPNKNPFKEKLINAIMPLTSKIYTASVNFKITPGCIAQDNFSPAIANIEAVLGDGVTRTFNINGSSFPAISQPITYTSTGLKTFSFKIFYANGTQKLCQQQIEVSFSQDTSNSRSGLFPEAEDFVGTNGVFSTIPFKGYDESTAKSGTLEYRTYYNTVTNPGYIPASFAFSVQPKLRKPVIILDGYDPGDGRKIYEGSVGYDSKNSSLYEQMYFDPDNDPQNNNDKNLVKELQDKGYDVTLVNFPNGADFIERNAMALVALLQRENSKLAGNSSAEKITLVGPSMGGLISRYALSYMEKNNIPHNTKLWVSFDSPHHGANIPLSTQAELFFLGTTAESFEAKTKFNENFNSPAARQMLIEQMENYPNRTFLSSSNNKNNNHPFRQQFMQNLTTNGISNSDGFPKQTRNIAVINGTTNGAKTNSEGQVVYDVAAFGALRIKGFYLVNRNLGTPASQVTTFEGRFTKIVKCRISFTNLSYTCGIDIYNRNRPDINTNPRGSMDVVQGGTFNTVGIIKKSIDENETVQENRVENRVYVPNHSFIPTISSLAFKNPNFDWNTNISRNLICNNEIPFETYYAPSTNQEHVMVTKEMVDWLLKEIDGIPQPPSFPLQDNLLSGPNIVCVNTNATFSFPDVCKIPGAATWSVSANLQIVSTTGYNVTVKGLTNGSGTITGTFENGLKTSKTIWVGTPIPDNDQINGPIHVSQYNEVYYSAASFKNATSYTWSLSNPQWQIVLGNGTQVIKINTRNAITSGTVTVRGINECGIGGSKSLNVTYSGRNIPLPDPNDCPPGAICDIPIPRMQNPNKIKNFSIFPNPSSDIINIEFGEKANLHLKETKISGELINLIGITVRKIEVNKENATLSVKGLNKGIYILKLYINDQVESHQIMVE